jgi:hypothetical protein
MGRNPFLVHLPERADAGAGASGRSVVSLLDRAREASLGLAPDGPVRTELAQATRLGRTQVNARAVFRILIDEGKLVRRIDVVEHTDAMDAWEEVARATLRELEGRPMRLSSTTKGAVLLVEVTSQMQLPSGRAAGHLPTVTPGAGTVSAQGDLSDIGAKAQRVVHTRLLDWSDPG